MIEGTHLFGDVNVLDESQSGSLSLILPLTPTYPQRYIKIKMKERKKNILIVLYERKLQEIKK